MLLATACEGTSQMDMLITDNSTDGEGTDITNYYNLSSHMDSHQRSGLTRIEVPEEVTREDLLAKCPFTLHASVTFGSCDYIGGVLTSKDGDLKLTVSKGTVQDGDHITFCMVTNLYGPFVIPSKCQTDVVSPYYWVGVTGSYHHFQIPVQVEFQHFAVVTACDPSHYQLLCCKDDDKLYNM